MSNTRQVDPERPDKDNPEWTRDISTKATHQLLRRGKDRQNVPKHQK